MEGAAAVIKDTHTPIRNIRVPDDLWDAAKAKAAENGETVSDVLIRALRRYVARKRRLPSDDVPFVG